MMEIITEDCIYEVLTKIAVKYDLKDWRHERQTFKSIAQNYFGVLMPVTLEGNQESKHITLHLVLKFAPPSELYRVSGAVTVMFAREIFLYSELLQKYQKLQEHLHLQHQFVIPRCYYVCVEYCKEVIAMQNMCVDGYSPYTDNRFLDLNHILAALKSLAKFHALSFILRKEDSIAYDKAKNICVPLTSKTNSRYINILLDRLMKAISKFENTSYASLLEVLKVNCDYFIESLISKVKQVCLCHGDMWKENILFKYENNMPISACIIDYQTTRVSSPAFDVLYLIVSSVDTSLRHNHFNYLFDTYYETFRQFLLNAHIDPKHVYSKDDFKYDLNIVGPACLIVANTALWLSSGLQEEGHVRSKYQFITEEDKFKAVEEYKTIIKAIIDDLTDHGYLKVMEALS